MPTLLELQRGKKKNPCYQDNLKNNKKLYIFRWPHLALEPQKYTYILCPNFYIKKIFLCSKCLKKLQVKTNDLFDQYKILIFGGGGLEDDLTAFLSFHHIKTDSTCLHKPVKLSSQKTERHFHCTFNSPMLFDNFGVTLRSVWH